MLHEANISDVLKNPVFKILKENFLEKFIEAEQNCHTICLPDIRNFNPNVEVDENFFDLHILKQQKDEGWFRSANPKISLIIEQQRNVLKLFSAPNYHPSFQKGLHYSNIVSIVYGVNKSFCQYKMFVLDRPLVPRYSKLNLSNSLNSISSTSSGVSSAGSISSKDLSTVTTVISATNSFRANAKTSSRQSSASSIGRPYQICHDELRRVHTHSQAQLARKSRSAPNEISILKKDKGKKAVDSKLHVKQAPRQWSADSGIDFLERRSSTATINDQAFILPPRITAYPESECYLMNLPRCDQFATHLARNLRPILETFYLSSVKNARNQIKEFATKLHRLSQESAIAFPRSASMVNNSPRFQEFLRIAVENVVVGSVHFRIFPVICYLSAKEDHHLIKCANMLRKKSTRFSGEQFGLPEDFCIPLSAAVVELAGLDMRTTPLDRMTCIYDTVEQVGVHIRESMLEAHADSEDINIPEDLAYPDEREMILLLATVVVQARPKHLIATLNYADLFAWTVPKDMIESVTQMSSAADFVRNIEPDRLFPPSGKLKREVSMEEIIQLTDELEQSFDRRGNRLEPIKSALDLHRERFAQRLEKSTADRTRRQEEAWARLDRCPTPNSQAPNANPRRSLLATIHSKLLCSTDSKDIIDHAATHSS